MLYVSLTGGPAALANDVFTLADLVQYFFRMRKAAAVQNQIAALLRHEFGGQIPDSSGGAGYQRPFSFYLIHLLSLLNIWIQQRDYIMDHRFSKRAIYLISGRYDMICPGIVRVFPGDPDIAFQCKYLHDDKKNAELILRGVRR